MIPVKSTISAVRLPAASLFAAMVLSIGCSPEMPAPPPKVFGSSAEEDFDWAMVRMKHAIERFRPSSGAGISTNRELDYELMPPSADDDRYTARVTLSSRTVFRVDPRSSEAQRRRAEAKKESEKIKLANPFKVPGEEGGEDDPIPIPDVPLAELNDPEIVDPRVPTQKLEAKRDYQLEYVSGKWHLKSKKVDENEQMLFDYALEQGEFAPGAATKN
jgi:hypothetical protein